MTNDFRRFQRGSGVFNCQCCGKRTRETAESGCEMCAACYTSAGISENEHDDGNHEEVRSAACGVCTPASFDAEPCGCFFPKKRRTAGR